MNIAVSRHGLCCIATRALGGVPRASKDCLPSDLHGITPAAKQVLVWDSAILCASRSSARLACGVKGSEPRPLESIVSTFDFLEAAKPAHIAALCRSRQCSSMANGGSGRGVYAHADMLRLMMVSKLMHVMSATQQTLASAHGGRCAADSRDLAHAHGGRS